jgi:hypothetical protein
MTFFTIQEFKNKYSLDVALWQIEIASEMIYNQVGLMFRNPNWDDKTCPTPIKNASMEQLRFILEYDIPALDNRGSIKAGAMESDLISDISSYALRILGNAGYLYRGNPMNFNMGITYPYGD